MTQCATPSTSLRPSAVVSALYGRLILVRAEVVGAVVPLWIDRADRHEAGEFDVARLLRRERGELVGLHDHEPAFGHCVSALRLVVGHNFVGSRVHHRLGDWNEIGSRATDESECLCLRSPNTA